MSITHIKNGFPLPVGAYGFQVMEDGISEASNSGKITAEVKLVGPSGNRFEFIRSICGHSYPDGVDGGTGNQIIRVVEPISYPDNPSLYLQNWSTSISGRPVSWTTGLPVHDLGIPFSGECDNLDCVITLHFGETEEDGTGVTDSRAPNPPQGTFLTIDESWSNEEVQVETAPRIVGTLTVGMASKPKETKPEHGNVNIQVHDININWTGVFAPDWTTIYSYMGHLNNNPFWGYPMGSVRLEGMQKTSKLNVRNNWVYDLRFTFRAKTVPAQDYATMGTSHALEVLNGRLGVWNRVWLPEGVHNDSKSIQTKQHWWVTAGVGGAYDCPLLPDGAEFWDIFNYPANYTVLT